MKKDQKSKKLAAGRDVLNKPRLRWLIGKKARLVGDLNVYGKKIPEDQYDAALTKIAEEELEKSLIINELVTAPKTALELSSSTGIPGEKVVKRLISLMKWGQIEEKGRKNDSPLYTLAPMAHHEETKPVSKKEVNKIGVYVCRCGLNIGGIIDCAQVASFARGLPDVQISREHKYLCSEQGQKMIRDDIEKLGLNRVVIASCSPVMHEPLFRKILETTGLNPYLLHMTNIREHCSWVHSREPQNATKKACDLTKMAVMGAHHLNAIETREVPVEKAALVVGGGIAGIQAALDLATIGIEVYLVEKSPSIGGRMAQLDKTYPTGDCSICILAPKMVEASRHPLIHILTCSEVKEVSGCKGSFEVKVLCKPRYVDVKKCRGCGECAAVCPIHVPNEFDEGLSDRKAIYIPFPQAVPSKYVVDRINCIECGKCEEKCDVGAIDHNQLPEEIAIRAGAIIAATGFDLFNPSKISYLGYRKYKNVITSMEFERIISSSGPTGGKLLRPSDGMPPKKVAFILCVGSRDLKAGTAYCSKVCCMYTIKDAQLLKDQHPDSEIVIFYTDIRAAGKHFEEYYYKAKKMGIEFIRGRPMKILETPSGNLLIRVEDTLLGILIERTFDLAVLSVGLVPSHGSLELQQTLGIPVTQDGFFKEAHPRLAPVDTSTAGIYICGCAQGPKDIFESAMQAGAASAKAAGVILQGKIKIESARSIVDEAKCAGCQLCVEVCPYGAPQFIESEGRVIIQEVLCQGCGSCVVACPSHAISCERFSDEQLRAEFHSALEE